MGTFVPHLTCLVLLLSVDFPACAAIRFENFAQTHDLRLSGDAAFSGRALRLTSARHDQSGAAWFVEKQPVGSGFDTTFRFQLTRQGGLGHGADGFAFVLQNSGPAALGGRGSAGGFAVADPGFHGRTKGIPWSVAVFFDTYLNPPEGDPSDNYVAFRTHGKPADTRWPAERMAFTPNLRVQLKDRKVHVARVMFQPPVLSVFLDDSAAPVLESRVDLSIVADKQGNSWVGFTASTGGGYENHDILSWSFNGTAASSTMSMVSSEITFLMSTCLPDRSLCTPERVVVEKNDAGYHVVLPANLEWGAEIPNPGGGAVSVENAHGIVCWDQKAKASDGCSGPAGAPTPAGAAFLSPDRGAGALLRKNRDGHTWFSVNGRSGESFKASEGFYEFDVAIR